MLGWHLIEASDLTALAQGGAEWADVIEMETHPVIEDAEAAAAAKKVPRQIARADRCETGPMTFKLHARVNRADGETIRQALAELGARAAVTQQEDEFTLDAIVEGEAAKDLNRRLLSALRKVHKRTTLRAQWTSNGNVTESYFDYVLKKTIKS